MRMVRISMALPLELYLGSSLFLPQLCIATKRSGKGTCTSTTTTKPKYKGNRETNFWPINGNLGTSNSMQSTDFRQIQDLGNNSIVMNTFPLIKLTNKNINRSTSFQRTHFKNDRRQNTNRGNIKRSLSDTEMNLKNNHYRAYDVTISKPSTANAQKAQTWQTKILVMRTLLKRPLLSLPATGFVKAILVVNLRGPQSQALP